MSEADFFESVEQTCARLKALCTHAELTGLGSGGLQEISAHLDKLRMRNDLLRAVLDEANDVVFAKDRSGRYAMINARGAACFGAQESDILGVDDRALFPPDVAGPIMAGDREVMESGQPQGREMACRREGHSMSLSVTTRVWHDVNGGIRGVIGVGRNLAAARPDPPESTTWSTRARSVAVGLILKEELLRRSLATELHSDLCQDIALARLKLSRLRDSAGPDLSGPLMGIEELLERADRTLRSITFRLSPPSLYDLGLVPALQWLAEDLGRSHGLHVIIEDDDFPFVSDESVRVTLFRVVRELLDNVAAHAGTGTARVRLSTSEGVLRISVEDSGAGFDTLALEREGCGLIGIREQLGHFGGVLQIDSRPGHGTGAVLTLPEPMPVGDATA